MNIHRIRQDFPIFQRQASESLAAAKNIVKGSQKNKPLVYLDNAATAQKPQPVIDALLHYYQNCCANIHRAVYDSAEESTSLYEATREKVAAFINAADPSEIVFTKGTTEGVNFIAQTWALDHLKAGDEIVITQAEHHSNFLPWQQVARRTGAQIIVIPIDKTTCTVIDPETFLTPKTRLVAVSQSSNVVGPIWNNQAKQLEKFIVAAQRHGALVLVDAAQSIVHQHVDVLTLGADFLVFSGHKMFGPTGIGVLYINKKHHAAVEPYQFGGSMIHEVTLRRSSWAPAPQKYEAGTPPIAEAIGLGAAIDYITQKIDWKELHKHEAGLCTQLIDGLEKIPGVIMVGNREKLRTEGHLISIAFEDVHTHDIASLLGLENIAVRAGHACAQPLVNHLGFDSVLRISMAAYNTSEEIELFLQTLATCLQSFRQALK